MNWGYAYTKQGFLHHITRGQYEKLNLSWPWSADFWIQARLFARALLQQFSPPLGFDNDLPAGSADHGVRVWRPCSSSSDAGRI